MPFSSYFTLLLFFNLTSPVGSGKELYSLLSDSAIQHYVLFLGGSAAVSSSPSLFYPIEYGEWLEVYLPTPVQIWNKESQCIGSRRGWVAITPNSLTHVRPAQGQKLVHHSFTLFELIPLPWLRRAKPKFLGTRFRSYTVNKPIMESL